MESDSAQTSWYSNLFLVTAVILTVMMALLMSQLDRLQTRLVPTVPIVAQVTEPVITPTPLSAIALATAVPASPTSLTSAGMTTTPASTTLASPTVECSQPPAGWVSYLVQSGDTLFALSNKTGSTVDQIVQANCLEEKTFTTGMEIYLPMLPPQQIACGPPNWWVRYTVEAGDTMFSLALSRGTTVYQIMNANCLTSVRLYTGRQIYLPPGGSTATPQPTAVPTTIPQPTSKPQPSNTPPPPPTLTNTPPPPPTNTFTSTPVTPSSTPVTPTVTSTVTPSPTRPSGNSTLAAVPGFGALGLTAFWLGLGLVMGIVLVGDNPLGRKRKRP